MTELQWDYKFALRQAGGNLELLTELRQLFYEASRADLEKVKGGQHGQDARLVVAGAHSIKGAAAGLGIEAIRRVAEQLENAGERGAFYDITRLAASLEDLVEQFQKQGGGPA